MGQFIFYIVCALPVLMWEMVAAINPERVVAFQKEYNSTPQEDRTELQSVFSWFIIYYFIWCLAGLAGSEWRGFLGIIVLGFLTSWAKRIFKSSHVLITAIDATITVALLLFIMINKFH